MINFIMIALSIMSILYYVSLTAIMGSVAFSKIFIIISLVSYIFYYANRKYNIWNKKWIKVVISIVVIIFIAIEGIIIYSGISRDLEQGDYVIVLGAGLRGENMTLSLKERVAKALDYCQKNKKSYVVVSGGKGPGESISEAEAMKRYLITNGIEQERILSEDKSRNTMENFKFSKDVIEKHSGKKVDNLNIKVITSNYHVFRSGIIAKRQGYSNIRFNSNKTNALLAPNYFFREFFALPKTLIFDK